MGKEVGENGKGRGAMEHAVSMEKGEQAAPLLSRSVSLPVQKKRSEKRALAAILAFQCFESIAYFGIATDLVVYFDSVFHGSAASNAAAATTWAGTCYIIPLAGALMADTFLGNYNTILISLSLYLPGVLMIALSATSPDHKLAFLFGLYVVAIGGGGVRSAIMPLGGDQFGDGSAEEKKRRSSFFSLFYLCSKVGILFSSTLIVWVQENVGWAIGFSIPVACLVLASAAFLLGAPAYRRRTPAGSPLKRALHVLVAAARKRRCKAPRGSRLLHEVDDVIAAGNSGGERLAHSDGLGFLDKAAIVDDGGESHRFYDPRSVCTVTQVEEVKILLRLLPIWAAGTIFAMAYFQMPTTFVQQGAAMDSTIGSFSVPPASLLCFEMVCVMLLATAYDRLLTPFARRRLRNDVGLSMLQRMGIGKALMVIAMATAALVEHKRLERARAGGAGLFIAWQLPQFFLLACSEVFCFIAQTEFFYGEAPETMKNVCASLALILISAGNFMSSLIVKLASRFTTVEGGDGGIADAGWLPDDLNEGHLDYFFMMLAGLSALNCVCFFVFAKIYTPKKVVIKDQVIVS